MALLPTPLLLFVSSSSALYLKNQGQLQHRLEVLFPFVGLFILTFVFGLLLNVYSHYRPLRLGLWIYYLTGPCFLLFAFLRNQVPHFPFLARLYQTTGGLVFWPGLLLAATFILYLRFAPQRLLKVCAALGIFLLASETCHFYTGLEHPAPQADGSIRDLLPSDPALKLPNIYHLILDGFQTDFFERALSSETREALEGFTYFPNNSSIYHTTFMSMASVLTGRPFSYDRHRSEYVREAFNSRTSLLYWLKHKGYIILAFLPGGGTERERVSAPRGARLFNGVVYHDRQVTDELIDVNKEAFWNLWLFSNLPEPLREAVGRRNWFAGLDEEDLRLLQRQKLLNRSAQVTSHLGFQNILQKEKDLHEYNRYNYIHLLIPHWPYNLRPDCSLEQGGAKTGPVEQSKCALKLVEDFINLLKSLGRFERSMILIHGDHGAFFRVKNDALTAGARSRSQRALLLVKPFGGEAKRELAVCEAETTLLDIKRTFMWSLAGSRAGEGLSDPLSTRLGPQRRLTPYIEGETLSSAKQILKRQGFTFGRVLLAHNPLYAAGKVIAQDPAPYKEAGDIKHVSILLSLGNSDRADLMPDYIGKNVADVIHDVIERTRRGSFPQSRIQHVEHGRALRGTVVRQTPAPGTKIAKSHRIALYESKGQ